MNELMSRIKFLDDMPFLLHRIQQYVEFIREQYITYEINLSHTIWIACLQFILNSYDNVIKEYESKEHEWLEINNSLKMNISTTENVLNEMSIQQERLTKQVLESKEEIIKLKQKLIAPVISSTSTTNNTNNTSQLGISQPVQQIFNATTTSTELNQTNKQMSTSISSSSGITITNNKYLSFEQYQSPTPSSIIGNIPLLPSNKRQGNVFINIKMTVVKVVRSILKFISFGRL